MAYSDYDILSELEPKAEEYLNRHLRTAKEWFPHEYVPWRQGRDFDIEPWTPDQPSVSQTAQTALEVNLLTEDNLPGYHRAVFRLFGGDGAWQTWANRWTAEEGRHSIVLRDYLTVTRNVDPVQLERGRMQQNEQGYDSDADTALDGMAYVSFQELATRISHRNTGRYTGEPVCDRILRRISADENLHMIFYRDVLNAAFEIAPSDATRAVARQVIDFEMPGAGIPGFIRKAFTIAQAGIYDLRNHHDEVVWPLLRHLRVFEATGLDPEAEKAREELGAFLERLDATATRYEDKRAQRHARTAERAAG